MLIQLLKSKTVWFSIILAVLSVVQGYIGLLSLGPTEQMFVGVAIAVAVTLLRIITTQPINQK